MPTIPSTFATKLDGLSRLLSAADRVVFDVESSDVVPRSSAMVGCGFYDPDRHAAAYINVGHTQRSDDFPKYAPEQLVETTRPFFENPGKHAIAHNTAFDLRWIIKHGGKVLCRVSDSMVRFHRIDENLSSFSKAPTRHRHVDISYGLKGLTSVFAGEQPPELFEVTKGQNAMFAPILPTAVYCLQDCVNTAFLFDYAERLLERDPQLHSLVDSNDDPSNVIVADMMWQGIAIDVEEAWRQRGEYERAIQSCRELIWRTTGVHLAVETKRDMIAFLKEIRIADALGYNPFAMPTWNSDKDPPLTTDILTDMFRDLESQDGRLVLAAMICKMDMQQRINAFCRPLAKKTTDDRLYLNSFMPTQASTRYSCSPNLQALPKRADKIDSADPVTTLPDECRENFTTRNIVKARDGYRLVSFDLTAAEPRYLAIACERAITERDSGLILAKRLLRAEREAKYPEIMRLLYSRRDNKAYKERDPIEWPDLEHDPLWLAFQDGRDPYHAFIEAMDAQGYAAAVASGEEAKWLDGERWRGKLGFLAPAYGVTAEALAVSLKWPLERTQQALVNLDRSYPMIPTLKKLVEKHLVSTAEVRTLWGRPRRINGYHQLCRPNPLIAYFTRRRNAAGKPCVQHYEARFIPVGTYRQGTQAFVERIHCVESGQIVMQCNPKTLSVEVLEEDDAFIHSVLYNQFNDPPFANIPYSQIDSVEERDTGLLRYLPRQAQAHRMLFNSIFQGSGADHLRWLMIAMDNEVCQRPEFRDCKLILTIHDSLLFEVPDGKWRDFAIAAKPILTRRPPWATLDIKVDAEVGIRFGKMKKVKL